VDQSQDIPSAAANTGSHKEVNQSQDIPSAAATNTGSHKEVDQSQDIPSAAGKQVVIQRFITARNIPSSVATTNYR
jgi:hypothetical protein